MTPVVGRPAGESVEVRTVGGVEVVAVPAALGIGIPVCGSAPAMVPIVVVVPAVAAVVVVPVAIPSKKKQDRAATQVNAKAMDRAKAYAAYLRGILTGRVTGHTREEGDAAYAGWRAWLVPGKRCFVNGRPVELLWAVDVGGGSGWQNWQDWQVRPLFVDEEDYEVRIHSRDRLSALHSMGR